MQPGILTQLFPPHRRALPHLLAEQAARFGDRPLVEFQEETWTFSSAVEIAGAWACALAEAGVRPGQRVAIMCSNRPEFLKIYFGCAWLGAIVVPINIASRGMQLQHILGNCDARLLVIEAELHPALLALDLAALAIERIWAIGEAASEPPSGTQPLPRAGGLMAVGDMRDGDTVAVVYTSGTTGPSKGVCCPHANLFWWGVNTADLLGLSEGERLYTTLPLFHVNALNTVYQALLTGSTVIIGGRFSVSGLWPALDRNGATVTYLLGAMAPMLLSRPETPLDRAHSVRIGLGPGVPARFHEAFRQRFGFGLVEGYGSTESNFVIGARPGEARPGTMGRVRPGFSVRVVDEEDNEVEAGQSGELLLRADEPFAFSTGYFGMPEKTLEAWRNLWLHTGDRVVRDADGYIRFVDRLKDAIRRRGENISSFEVEQVLLSHAAVAAAAVFPVPSPMAEDEVMAVVVLKPDTRLREAELIDFCRPRLSSFAVPRYLEFMGSLPVTENGKPQKFKLRERGVTVTTWDREAEGGVPG